MMAPVSVQVLTGEAHTVERVPVPIDGPARPVVSAFRA